MPKPSVYGHVHLRPVRVGICDEFDSMDSVTEFVATASKFWGGVYFMALPADSPEEAESAAVEFGLDVLTTLRRDSHPEFRNREGFRYQAFHERGLLDPDESSAMFAPLKMAPIVDGLLGGRAPLPFAEIIGMRWKSDNPLAALLACMFGNPAENPPSLGMGLPFGPVAVKEQFLPDGVPIPVPRPGTGNLSLTAVALQVGMSSSIHGVAFVDPTDPKDLLAFWNLRAAGGTVIPWPIGLHEDATRYLADWVAIQSGAGERTLGVWTPPEADRDACIGVVQRAAADGTQILLSALELVPRGEQAARVESLYTRSFSSTFDVGEDTFSVPLPEMQVLLPRPWYESRGLVIAEVEVQGSGDMPPGRGTAIPVPRRLAAGVLARYVGGLNSFARPNSDGTIVAVEVSRNEVDVPIVSAWSTFETVFDAAGLKPRPSDAGKYVTRVIEMLGGVGPDSAALQPAVRAVLRKSPMSPYGYPATALIEEAKGKQGDWPSHISFYHTNYPEWVVAMLCHRGLLTAVLKSSCLACGNPLVVEARDVSGEVTCRLCGDSRPLALHIATRKPQWLLAATTAVDSARVSETQPAMAALSLLTRLSYRGAGNPYLAGIRVLGNGIDCELDLAVALREDGQPVFVVGECKSYKEEFGLSHVQNLLSVQKQFFNAGLECYVLFSTMRPELTLEERNLFRDSFKIVKETSEFRHFGIVSVEPILPLVFTSVAMSASSTSPDRLGADARSLAELARQSCEVALGSMELKYRAGQVEILWVEDDQA